MAKCRNCKKEIDANATRCPYCLTEMPTSDFIANLKSGIIAISAIGFTFFVLYWGFTSFINDFDFETASILLKSLIFGIGIGSAFFAIGCFINAKNWAEVSKSVGFYITLGFVCVVIAIFFIPLSLKLLF